MPTSGFDGFRILEQQEIFAQPVDDVVLTPHLIKSGLDVLGEVGLDTTAGEEPEQTDELEDDEEECEGELHDHRQCTDECRGHVEDRLHGSGTGELGGDEPVDGEDEQPEADAGERHLGAFVHAPRRDGEDPGDGEDDRVEMTTAFSEEYEELAHDLQTQEQREFGCNLGGPQHCVARCHQRVGLQRRGIHHPEQQAEQERQPQTFPGVLGRSASRPHDAPGTLPFGGYHLGGVITLLAAEQLPDILCEYGHFTAPPSR